MTDRLEKEFDAMLDVARALEPLSRPQRARVMLAAALQFDPIPMTFDEQLRLLRVANGRA